MRLAKELNPVRTPGGARSQARAALSRIAAACLLAAAGAQAQAQVTVPDALPTAAQPGVDLFGNEIGMVRLIVQFNEAPVSRMRPNMNVLTANRGEMRQHREKLLAAKAPRLVWIRALGGRVQNTTEYAVNGAVIDLPADKVAVLRSLPGIRSVRPAGVYQMNQAAGVPSVPELIRTAQVNAAGNGGAGVAIAIIDSGVDYTHASFGGPGTTAYYASAVAGTNPVTIGDTPGVFPNGPRVKGGYDWLGDTWSGVAANPGGLAVTPDPDPIDNKQAATDFAGHGTNSASAAAGSAVPGGQIRAGSAPNATILAYRGCSRISRSCEGSALLNSVESVIAYAAGNPNANQPGAQNPALPAGTRFVINMSLGAGFGLPLIDDLSEASRNAARAGITVVASAGNSGDIPLIVGTPSATDMAISVAASQPAMLTGPALSVGAPVNTSFPLIGASFGTVLTSPLTAPLAFAGASTTLNTACGATGSGSANPSQPADLPLNSRVGTIGVADRGVCGFSEKGLLMERAGVLAGLIANNAAGQGPIGMAAGVALPTLTPHFSLGTAEGAQLKVAMAANPGLLATISPLADAANVANGINLVDLIADFSSRGFTMNNAALKPDVTAPGVNIFMANVGTGTGGTPNSGTSFSSPLAAGVAALVLSARPTYTPWQVKAAMMNTANPNVFATKVNTGTATSPVLSTTLAGTTRMGAGRVDAERAVATTTLAYDSQDVDPGPGVFHNASLSFGPVEFSAPGTSSVSRTVVVENRGTAARTYNLSAAMRFANDTAKGISVSTSVPSITVPAGGTGSFQVLLSATGSALPTAGGQPVRLLHTDTCTTNANPPAPVAACTNKFNDVEIDGFVTIDGGSPTDQVSVPFLAVPRQASDVSIQRLGTALFTRNTGAATTTVDVFNLIGTPDPQDQPAVQPGSEQLPVDLRALGFRYLPGAFAGTLPANVTSRDLMQFAVSMWQPQDTLRASVLEVEIDTNNDGVTDFTVSGLNTTTNVNSTFIAPAGGLPGNAFFNTAFPLNSSRAVMTVFPSLMGLNVNSRIGLRVVSRNFRGGPVLDRLPDSGAFQYVRPSAMVNVPSSLGYLQAPGVTNRVNFTTNSANLGTSPGDKGFLYVSSDNPVPREVTTIQLVN